MPANPVLTDERFHLDESTGPAGVRPRARSPAPAPLGPGSDGLAGRSGRAGSHA